MENIFTLPEEWDLIKWVATQLSDIVPRFKRDRWFFQNGETQEKRDNLRHRVSGQQKLSYERAPTLSATIRIIWQPDIRRPKNTPAFLLVDFRQYTAMSSTELETADGNLEISRKLNVPKKTVTVRVWPDRVSHPFTPPPKGLRTKKYIENRKNLSKAWRSARQPDEWEWLTISSRSTDRDISVQMLVVLLQHSMVELTNEMIVWFASYARVSREASFDLIEYMRQHYRFPQRPGGLKDYLGKVKKGIQKDAQQREVGVEDEGTLEYFEDQWGKYGYRGNRAMVGKEAFTVDEAVISLQEIVGRSTLYTWIKRGEVPHIVRDGRIMLTHDGLEKAKEFALPRLKRSLLKQMLANQRGIKDASAERRIRRLGKRGTSLDEIAKRACDP